MVVVVFVDVEQLQVVGRHDGEAVVSQCLHQLGFLAAELEGVDDVLRLQLILTCLQPCHEGLFFLGVADGSHLPVDGVPLFVVARLSPEAVFHYLVVPRRGAEQSAQVGTHEAVALPCGEGIAQDAHFRDAQL